MRRGRLDQTDRAILAALQENGRMTNVALSAAAGVSAPPCLRRVRALERNGVIRGYHADVAQDAVGYDVTVFAFVGLDSQAEPDLRGFEERIEASPMVRECWMLTGEVDFILKVVAPDWDAYQRFLTEELTAAPHVAQVKSGLAIRNSKMAFGVPIDPA